MAAILPPRACRRKLKRANLDYHRRTWILNIVFVTVSIQLMIRQSRMANGSQFHAWHAKTLACDTGRLDQGTAELHLACSKTKRCNQFKTTTMATSQPPESAELQHVRNYWATMLPSSAIYTFLLEDISLTSASKGNVTARLKLQPVHMNSKGSLHGTVSACIVDCFGGLAVASTGLDKTGLSTDIHTTYVSTAKVGDILEIEGRASKVGGMMGFTTVEIRKEGGGVVAMGSHTKYVKV